MSKRIEIMSRDRRLTGVATVIFIMSLFSLYDGFRTLFQGYYKRATTRTGPLPLNTTARWSWRTWTIPSKCGYSTGRPNRCPRPFPECAKLCRKKKKMSHGKKQLEKQLPNCFRIKSDFWLLFNDDFTPRGGDILYCPAVFGHLFGPTRKSSPWGNFSDGGLNQSIKRRLSL